MEYCLYFIIHDKMQSWLAPDKTIKRKEFLNFLKYFHVSKRTKYLVIEDMVELGLIKKLNRDLLEWLPNAKTEQINKDGYINTVLIRKASERA